MLLPEIAHGHDSLILPVFHVAKADALRVNAPHRAQHRSGGSAPSSTQSEAEKRQAKKDLNRIERQLTKLTQQADKVKEQMTAAGSKADADFEQLAELNKKLQEIGAEQEELEMEWLEASEVLE